MRVIAKSALEAFWKLYPDSEQALRAWHQEATHATWRNPPDIKEQYRSASILKGCRVVFNIAGNKYRLLVEVGVPDKRHLRKVRGNPQAVRKDRRGGVQR